MAKLQKFILNTDPAARTIHRNDPLDKAVSGALIKQPGPPPTVVPMPDEQATLAAKKKVVASSLGRTGRASTILTDTTDRLGP